MEIQVLLSITLVCYWILHSVNCVESLRRVVVLLWTTYYQLNKPLSNHMVLFEL